MIINSASAKAFSLVELLIVIAVIAILAAILFPVISSARQRAQRMTCLNNLRQINFGIRMYSDDSRDATPSPGSSASSNDFPTLYSAYKQLMTNYVGSGQAIFVCPADRFYPNHIFTDDNPATQYMQQGLHETPYVDFSSYSFNGGDGRIETFGTNGVTITRPGLGNAKLSAVKHPSRTVLIAEASAFGPWSWHDPSSGPLFNNAKNVVSFVDGHESYLPIFLDRSPHKGLAIFYNPPAGYDYQWTPD